MLDALDVPIRVRRGEGPRAGHERALDQVGEPRAHVAAPKACAAAESVDRLVADVRALRRDPEADAAALEALRAALDAS